MSIRPDHRNLETNPPWTVQAVFDPDGLGGDFAYTIGLTFLGAPELHLYARPSLGEDPGADWKFSPEDLCRILNELAAKLVRGSIGIGSAVERTYDGGSVRVRFHVDPPGDRDQLEAFGIPPHAEVLPVRWSLHREPEGPLLPMTPDAIARAAREYAAINEALTSTETAHGWRLPERPSFDAGQRYGPRTPLVLARAAEVWQARTEILANLLHTAVDVATATGSLTYPGAWARAVARPVGRTAAMDRLEDDLQAWFQAFGSQPDVKRQQHQCTHLLDDVLRICLLVEVVADVAPLELVIAARGPVLAAGRSAGVAPGKEWFAAEEVMVVFDALTASLRRREIREIGARHLRACEENEKYGELEDRLLAWAVVSAAGMPDLTLGGALAQPPGLQRWASVLTSALTHRARLSAEEVTLLANPMRDLLPTLESRLNQPIVAKA